MSELVQTCSTVRGDRGSIPRHGELFCDAAHSYSYGYLIFVLEKILSKILRDFLTLSQTDA